VPATPEGRAGNADTMPQICVHLRLSAIRIYDFIALIFQKEAE
jgi:hypothetical protein